MKYREENGKFTSRKQIKNVQKLGNKTYEQAVGFLRILSGDEKFDETSIHPDNYQDASLLLSYLHLDKNDIVSFLEHIRECNKCNTKSRNGNENS